MECVDWIGLNYLQYPLLARLLVLRISLRHGGVVGESVGMGGASISLVAVVADVEVGADLAAPALTGFDVAMARVARDHEGRRRGIVQVVQNHHR